MDIKRLKLGVVSTNCYIISNMDTKEAIVFDPADHARTIIEQLQKDELNLVGILLTHGHFDHIMAARELADVYDTKIYASEFEKDLLGDGNLNCSISMGGRLCTLAPDVLLKDGDVKHLAGYAIEIIHTPGHTIGGVCYLFKEQGVLISGDTLFRDSIGRSDLPTGNGSLLIQSIRNKLMILEDDITVLPGHEEPTTIGYEKVNNFYLS